MRIVHVIDYFQAHVGYQEYYLAKEQQRMGHDVAVVSSDRYHPAVAVPGDAPRGLSSRRVGRGRSLERGVRVHRLRCLAELRTACLLSGLEPVLAELRPQVVHCHGIFYSFAAWRVAGLRAKLGFRLLYDVHAADFNTSVARGVAKRAFHGLFRAMFVRSITAEADAIVAVGPEEREFICRECGLAAHSVQVIPLGVDTHTFRFDPVARDELRQSLGVGADTTLFLFCGKVAPSKETEVLLRALALLRQRALPAQALIVGSGPSSYLECLRRSVGRSGLQDAVRWLGFVDQSRLPGIMSAADVGVWPGIPSIAAQEAISTGLPVILRGHRAGAGDADLLVSNRNGLLFRPGDAADLAVQMSSLMRDRGLRRSMGQLGRRLAEEQLSWRAIAERFMRAYGFEGDNPGDTVVQDPYGAR